MQKKIYPNVLTPVVSRVEWEWSRVEVEWVEGSRCSGLSAFDSASASVQKSLGRQKLPERTNTWVLGVCVSIVSLQLSRRRWSGHITVNYLQDLGAYSQVECSSLQLPPICTYRKVS